MKTQAEFKNRWRRRFKRHLTVWASGLLLTLSTSVQAQFTYTTNNGTITITGYTGPGGAVIIPSTINGLTVTGIGDKAFQGRSSVTNVVIANSITSIGNSAFAGTSLTSVVVPNGVTSIGDAAFSACFSLASVTLGNSVTSISNNAFIYCSSLTNVVIPNSVTSIGDQAFCYCSGLTSITIPNSVTIIGFQAFMVCSSLTNIMLGDSIGNIGGGAFRDCTRLTNITIPNSVTSIGEGAFWYCTRLTSVTIPNSVTNIGPSAFGECTNLPAITVDAFSPAYSSVDGILFNKSQTTLNEYPAGKAGNFYAIPNSVTSIGEEAFWYCTRLTSVTIPNSVFIIGDYAFASCTGLTNVAIPDSVTSIGSEAFEDCDRLTNVTIGHSATSIGRGAFVGCDRLANVTIGHSVISIGDQAFGECYHLTGVYFEGDAPSLGSSSVFENDSKVTVYYLLGTTGWGSTFGGRPTALWVEVPNINTSPLTQTAEAGSAVGFWVHASSPLPLFYFWHLNDTNLLSSSTNRELELTNVQFSQSGAYTVVISNALGTVTSVPAMLNVIAAVERRPVPSVKVMGDVGSLLNLDYANSLSPAPDWTTLGSVSLISTSQLYFDVTAPLPLQRFYRAWQTVTPGVVPSLNLKFVPAITLTGNVGDSLRLDYINAIGPTDAWVTLATVTLTNTSQLYFDVSAPGQPTRLYRIVPVP